MGPGPGLYRCNVHRSIRIDVHSGDRLGTGGYDYSDAPVVLADQVLDTEVQVREGPKEHRPHLLEGLRPCCITW
jgi:hypothetical protein